LPQKRDHTEKKKAESLSVYSSLFNTFVLISNSAQNRAREQVQIENNFPKTKIEKAKTYPTIKKNNFARDLIMANFKKL